MKFIQLFVIISFLFASEILLAFHPPVLLEVQEEIDGKQFTTEFKIDHFQSGSEIKLNLYEKSSQKFFELSEDEIYGDYGILSKKEKYKLSIPLDKLPQNFSFKNFVLFPKLIYKSRIYYEMKKISRGEHPAIIDENVIAMKQTDGFYISKFEISNEQFLAFIKNDGYEMEEYWITEKGIMKSTQVGWFFQGKYRMNAPRDWDMTLEKPWANSNSSFIYGPISKISWFEAAAFCKWMNTDLPKKDVYQICCAMETEENEALYSPVCTALSKGVFPIHFIKSNVAEWLVSHIKTTTVFCGPGCREVHYLKNNGNFLYDFPILDMACPLFTNEILGFRFIIDYEN